MQIRWNFGLPLIRIPGYKSKKVMTNDWMDFDRGVVETIALPSA